MAAAPKRKTAAKKPAAQTSAQLAAARRKVADLEAADKKRKAIADATANLAKAKAALAAAKKPVARKTKAK